MALQAVIGEAISRGELPADTDAQGMGDELGALVFFQMLTLRAERQSSCPWILA